MCVKIFQSSLPHHRQPLHIFEMICNVSVKVSSRKVVKGFWRQMQPAHPHHGVSVVLPAFQEVLHPKDLVDSLVAQSLFHHIPQHALIILGIRNLSPTLGHPHPSSMTIKGLPPQILGAQSPYPRLHHHHLLLEFRMFWKLLQTLIAVHLSEHLWLVTAVPVPLTQYILLHHLHKQSHGHPSNRKALLGEPLRETLRRTPEDGPPIIMSLMLLTF
jgi:hypothetical protein